MKKKSLKRFSQNLRTNQTPQERHLWYDFLNKLPLRFHRQYVIGNYIVDFCCPERNIVIELDGCQHYDDFVANEKDKIRDKTLHELGYTVLRYTNLQIESEFDSVCADIYAKLDLPE